MIERRVLHPGQWLGTANRIVSMRMHKGEWVATDQVGKIYVQSDFPHGLKTSDMKRPCSGLPRTPWPPKTGDDDE